LLKHSGHQHEHMIEPIGYFFVPVFFVLTGMQVDLNTLADPAVLGVGLGITMQSPLLANWWPGWRRAIAANGWSAGAWCRAARSA
jgi:Kef-type K+ transport system membrane component KefB